MRVIVDSFWTHFDTFSEKSTSNCEEKTLQISHFGHILTPKLWRKTLEISHFGHILTPFCRKSTPKLWRKTVRNTGKMRSIMERKSFPRSLPGERKKLSFRSVNDCVKTCIFSNIRKISFSTGCFAWDTFWHFVSILVKRSSLWFMLTSMATWGTFVGTLIR